MDDIGVDTSGLSELKQILYVNGIGAQINAGEWDKLDDTQRLPRFSHLLLWRRPSYWIAGRIWSSSDGKGRSLYPMIACCQFSDVNGLDACRRVFPLLQTLEEEIKAAPAADGVRAACGRVRASLRTVLDETAPTAPAVEDGPLLEQMQGTAGEEGLLRAAYQVQTQMAPFAEGAPPARPGDHAPRPQQLRGPVAKTHPVESLLLWTRFFTTFCHRQAPLMFFLPHGESWLDVTVGLPAEHEFFCLRASLKAIPSAIDIPYTLDDTNRAAARELYAKVRNAPTAAFQIRSNADSADATKSTWFLGRLMGR